MVCLLRQGKRQSWKKQSFHSKNLSQSCFACICLLPAGFVFLFSPYFVLLGIYASRCFPNLLISFCFFIPFSQVSLLPPRPLTFTIFSIFFFSHLLCLLVFLSPFLFLFIIFCLLFLPSFFELKAFLSLFFPSFLPLILLSSTISLLYAWSSYLFAHLSSVCFSCHLHWVLCWVDAALPLHGQ